MWRSLKFSNPDCTAPPAISTSTLPYPSIAPLITHAHSDHARPGSRAYLTALTRASLLRARIGDEAPIQAEPYGACYPHRRGERLLPSRRPHPRLVPDPPRTRRRSLGGLGRLQTRRRPHLRALRAASLPYLRHRVHLRPAHLPVGRCRADCRGNPALVARQPGGGACQHSVRVPGGQGAAYSLRCSTPAPAPWSFTNLWSGINARLSCAGIALPLPAETTDFSEALILAAPGAQGSAWAAPLRPRLHRLCFGMDAHPRSHAAAFRWIVVSSSPITPIGPNCFKPSRQTGAETVWVTHGYIAPDGPLAGGTRQAGRCRSNWRCAANGERAVADRAGGPPE